MSKVGRVFGTGKLLGLTFGIDPRNLTVKLPLIGWVGLKRLRGSAQARPPLEATE